MKWRYVIGTLAWLAGIYGLKGTRFGDEQNIASWLLIVVGILLIFWNSSYKTIGNIAYKIRDFFKKIWKCFQK